MGLSYLVACHCYYLVQFVYIVYCLLNVVAKKLSPSLVVWQVVWVSL